MANIVKSLFLALILLVALNSPAEAKRHKYLKMIGQAVTCPIYIVGGYTVGHIFGGVCGVVGGLQMWDRVWNGDDTYYRAGWALRPDPSQ